MILRYNHAEIALVNVQRQLSQRQWQLTPSIKTILKSIIMIIQLQCINTSQFDDYFLLCCSHQVGFFLSFLLLGQTYLGVHIFLFCKEKSFICFEGKNVYVWTRRTESSKEWLKCSCALYFWLYRTLFTSSFQLGRKKLLVSTVFNMRLPYELKRFICTCIIV